MNSEGEEDRFATPDRMAKLISFSPDTIDALNESSSISKIQQYENMEKHDYLDSCINLFSSPASVSQDLKDYLLRKHPKLRKLIYSHWEEQNKV